MPGVSGVTVVTTTGAAAYPFLPARLRVHWAPGVPTPCLGENKFKARANRAAGSRSRASHCEERLVRRSSTSEGGSDEAIHIGRVALWIASLRAQ